MKETLDYYERRAPEYDSTSWEHPTSDRSSAARVRSVLQSLPAARTVDIGCGTGYVTRWLPGTVTLLDSSAAMLAIAKVRLPESPCVRSTASSLPFVDAAFERSFAGNLYGHLDSPARSSLVREMLRIAGEAVILEQLAESGRFSEGPELRRLADGSTFTIHKCYFTVDRLLNELGGGEVLMSGPSFVVVRRRV